MGETSGFQGQPYQSEQYAGQQYQDQQYQGQQYPGQQNPGQQYQSRPFQGDPNPPPRRHRGALLIGLATGLVVALLVGSALMWTGAAHFGGAASPGSADTQPITLPANLGGLQDQDDAAKATGQSATAQQRTQQMHQRAIALTRTAYQQANGGAAVAVRLYADSGFKFLPAVIAIRAANPGLTVGIVADPADLAMEADLQEIKTFGDVQCEVANQPTAAGQTVDPEKSTTVTCQRTGPSLTVLVKGEGAGSAGQQQMIAMTNAAWSALSGS